MWQALRRFVRRHKHAEEAAAEAATVEILWTVLRTLGVFGAGAALAAVATIAATSTSKPPPRVAVAYGLALENPKQQQLVRQAKLYGPRSGIVYVWGGASPSAGFDCSGYLQYVYRRAGILIPRTTRTQWTSTSGAFVPRSLLRAGDAVYFEGSLAGANAGPPPGHVAIYVGAGKLLEYYSSGRPAHTIRLAAAPGFMGGKRWWHRTTVQKKHASTIRWFARHFHVKIYTAAGRWVTFKTWTGRGHVPPGRYRRILDWAHSTRRSHRGSPVRLEVRF